MSATLVSFCMWLGFKLELHKNRQVPSCWS